MYAAALTVAPLVEEVVTRGTIELVVSDGFVPSASTLVEVAMVVSVSLVALVTSDVVVGTDELKSPEELNDPNEL